MANNQVILHLTDLHFPSKADTRSAQHEAMFNAMVETLKTLFANETDWKPTHLCITGDITLRGDANGYANALEKLTFLIEAIDIPISSVFICAGNHDVQRKYAEVLAFPVKGKQIKIPSNSEEADAVLDTDFEMFRSSFLNYEKFCQDFGLTPYLINSTESFLVGERSDERNSLKFVALNSSWFCRGKEDRGNLWLGWKQVQALFPDKKVDGVKTIVLTHHPREWFNPEEYSAARLIGGERRKNPFDYLSKRSELILTGHTHGEIRDADRIAMGAYHLTGGASAESDTYTNSVRLIRVEPDGFRYRSISYMPEQADHTWFVFPKEQFLPLIEMDSAQGKVRDAWIVGLRTFADWPFDRSVPFHHVFDWSSKFNHTPPKFPSAAEWESLETELSSKKVDFQDKTRLIKLTPGIEGRTGGSLTAGFLFGHVFQGFDIHVEQDAFNGSSRDTWRSEVQSELEDSVSTSFTELGTGDVAALILSVGFDISQNVTRFAEDEDIEFSQQLKVSWIVENSYMKEEDAIAFKNVVAREVREKLVTSKEIHIFYRGPYGLFILVGKALNRVGQVHLYEFVNSEYTKMFSLNT